MRIIIERVGIRTGQLNFSLRIIDSLISASVQDQYKQSSSQVV
jgi:hypothetical protein